MKISWHLNDTLVYLFSDPSFWCFNNKNTLIKWLCYNNCTNPAAITHNYNSTCAPLSAGQSCSITQQRCFNFLYTASASCVLRPPFSEYQINRSKVPCLCVGWFCFTSVLLVLSSESSSHQLGDTPSLRRSESASARQSRLALTNS